MSDDDRAVEGRRDPVQPPPVILSLIVGASSLSAAVRDLLLRARVTRTGLEGDAGQLTAGYPDQDRPRVRRELDVLQQAGRLSSDAGGLIGAAVFVGRARAPGGVAT